MNRRFLLISSIVLGLSVTGCNHPDKQNGNDSAATDTFAVNAGSDIKQTANTSAQIYGKPQVPVLCYHRIADGEKGDYKVSQATFTAHMSTLADNGYHTISPAQLYDYLVYNKALPEKPVMITFDDSRAEHSAIAAPVMEKLGFRGVFFIMTITYNKKHYMTKEQIATLANAGHTIGMHTWDHTMVTKYKDSADWQKEVVEPKGKLEKIVGMPVEYFAYPNGVFNHTSAEQLSKYFKLSFSLSTKRDSTLPLQTVRRIIVSECSAQGLLNAMQHSFSKK